MLGGWSGKGGGGGGEGMDLDNGRDRVKDKMINHMMEQIQTLLTQCVGRMTMKDQLLFARAA